MTACIALFRGINVGGHQKVKMSELKELHEQLGLKDVSTYIQSGNVVFRCEDADTKLLAGQIEESFAQKFGFRVGVAVRTLAELEDVIAQNPFQEHVLERAEVGGGAVLANRLESSALEELQKAYSGPEELCLMGQELYTYYPNSIGTSKLTLPLIEKKLKTVGTGRNWNTVLQLQKMMLRLA